MSADSKKPPRSPDAFEISKKYSRVLFSMGDVFNNPKIYITENGFAQVGPVQIEDVNRCEFYKSTISEVAKAMEEDGVNVCGYFAWSLMDNFEWADGFSVRFGLFHVDFSDAELSRTVYQSGQEYAKIIAKSKSASPI